MFPTDRLRRVVAGLGLVAGVVHLLAPRLLLSLARWGYDRVLAVDFDPRPGAVTRVRLVGLALLAASLVASRLDDLAGTTPDDGTG